MRETHLDRKRVGKEGQEPSKRDGRQLDAEVLEVISDVGEMTLNEVSQYTLIGLRDEEVRGVIVGGEDFLQILDMSGIHTVRDRGLASMMHTRTQNASSSAGCVRRRRAVRLFIP